MLTDERLGGHTYGETRPRQKVHIQRANYLQLLVVPIGECSKPGPETEHKAILQWSHHLDFSEEDLLLCVHQRVLFCVLMAK